MLLLFSSTDYTISTLRALCSSLREEGYLVCAPGKYLPLDQLSQLPITAATLRLGRSQNGLPSVAELRQYFPKIRTLVLSRKNPSYIWRSIPETDAELTAPYSAKDIYDMLDHLGAHSDRSRSVTRRHGIELPSDRHTVLLGVRRTSLTAAEYTLLRLLLLAENPLPAEALAAALCVPRSAPPTASVPVHIHALNQKAAEGGIPRLIGYRYRTGYILLPPYGSPLLPEDKMNGVSR